MSEQKSWAERTADHIQELSAHTEECCQVREAVLLALESYAEMKTAKLKVMLARCLEVIETSNTMANDDVVSHQCSDEFLQEVLQAIE